MTVSPSIPATVHMRRNRLLGLVATVAVVAAGVTWAVTAVAGNGNGTAQQTAKQQPSVNQSTYANGIAKLTRLQQAAAFGGHGAVLDALGLSVAEKQYVQGITSLSPVQQAAAFGGHGAVLDALGLSAREKRYVQGITSLTQVQQAAAFGR